MVHPQSTPAGEEAVIRKPAKTKRTATSKSPRLGKHVFLVASALLTLFPLLLLISTALRTPQDSRVDPFALFGSFAFDNLATAWVEGRFSEFVLNSLILSVPSTILALVLATMAGYAFARLRFPGRTMAFYVVVAGLLVPFFTIMIPLYFQLRDLGLLNTLIGVQLVLVSTGTAGLAFGTFFMRAFFLDLPIELEQAARVDGCSEWQLFRHVMVPLVRSAAAALAVYTFLQNWNNFLVPLLYLPGGKYRPLTAGLYLFASGRSIDIGPLAAGTLITILPVVFLFVALQRHVIRGFVAGAVKG